MQFRTLQGGQTVPLPLLSLTSPTSPTALTSLTSVMPVADQNETTPDMVNYNDSLDGCDALPAFWRTRSLPEADQACQGERTMTGEGQPFGDGSIEPARPRRNPHVVGVLRVSRFYLGLARRAHQPTV